MSEDTATSETQDRGQEQTVLDEKVPIAAGTVGVGVVGKITCDKKKKKGLFAKK